MPNFKEYWEEFKRLLPWLLIPFAFWLLTSGVAALEPFLRRTPQLQPIKSEMVSLRPAKVVNSVEGQVRYNADPISATIYAAFPNFLPSAPDETAPLMLMVQPSVTATLTETFVHLTIQADGYPLIVRDSTSTKLSQPLLFPVNGEAIFYQVRTPSRAYTIRVNSTLHGKSQVLIQSSDIKIQGKMWGGLFQILQLLGNVVPLPVLIGSLFGYATQVRKRWQERLQERETELRKLNDRIRALTNTENYEEVWKIYKEAYEKYLEFNPAQRRKELNPIRYVHPEEFKDFILIWYSEDNASYGEDSASNEGDLDSLLWVHQNLELDVVDQHLFSLLRDHLESWLEIWDDGEPKEEIIKWIQTSFSVKQSDYLLGKVDKAGILENSKLKILKDNLAAPSQEINLNDLGIFLKEDVFGFGFYRFLSRSIFNVRKIMNRQPFLIIGSRGTGKTTLALSASLQMLKNEKEGLSMFPCYVDHLPVSETDDKILQWLLRAAAYRVFVFLMNNPSYWKKSSMQSQMCMAWLINNVYTRVDIEMHPMARTFDTKMLLKSLLSYAESTASTELRRPEALDLYLDIIGDACPAPCEGLVLLVDPVPLSWKQVSYRKILRALADRAELLAKHNIFLKLFVPEKTPELYQSWTFEQATISWDTEKLSEMLKQRIESSDRDPGKFDEITRKNLASSVSTPRQLLCLAKAWNEVADDMLSYSEDQQVSWIQETIRSKCDM